MKNPLIKRLPREFTGEIAKYIVIFIFMTAVIGLISGFLIADGSVLDTYNKSFDKYNVEVLDMETALSPECFYDTGHLNYDVGSAIFTQMIDEWL